MRGDKRGEKCRNVERGIGGKSVECVNNQEVLLIKSELRTPIDTKVGSADGEWFVLGVLQVACRISFCNAEGSFRLALINTSTPGGGFEVSKDTKITVTLEAYISDRFKSVK